MKNREIIIKKRPVTVRYFSQLLLISQEYRKEKNKGN